MKNFIVLGIVVVLGLAVSYLVVANDDQAQYIATLEAREETMRAGLRFYEDVLARCQAADIDVARAAAEAERAYLGTFRPQIKEVAYDLSQKKVAYWSSVR